MRKASILLLVGSWFLSSCGSSTQQAPGPATHFSVTAQAAATAGVQFNVTVQALDASNNLATSYGGVVILSSSDAQAVLPFPQAAVAGVVTMQVTLFSSGNQTITANDSATTSIVGVSNNISVKVLTTTHFSVQAPASTTTGAQINVTVTALDASNNQVPTYAGLVHFTSTDAQAQFPGDSGLANGTGIFPITLTTAGNQTITATDTGTSSITGTSGAVNVMGVTHFSITTPSSATVGSAFVITVNALDAVNGVVPAYSGTVAFTSNDPHADLPVTQTMTTGTQTFELAFRTAGSETVTITDTVTSITGVSSAINVSAAAAANQVPLVNLPVEPAAVTPGMGDFSLTVNGTGFVSGSTVFWNGSARTTTFVSKSTLKAAILAADVASPTTAAITVVNPAPGGGTSNVAFVEATLPTLAVDFGVSQLGSLTNTASVATADFNHDGKMDMVITSTSGAGAIEVFLGNGDGTFQTGVNYAAGVNPDAIAVGDVNGDGKLDLVVGNGGSANVSVLLGNGDGTFQAAANFTIPCCNPSSLVLGDFNEDGKLDIAVIAGGTTILLGNGDGTFQSALTYNFGGILTTVAVGDFNGDGHLDLAVTDSFLNNVDVLLGNGDGKFQPALLNPVSASPNSVMTGDFNGDGILDLATGVSPVGLISVLLGNGNGTFQAPVDYNVGLIAGRPTLADLNGDGKLDVVLPGSNLIDVLLGNGDGTFQPVVDYGSLAMSLTGIAIADFNGHGRLDVVLTQNGGGIVELAQDTLAPSVTVLDFPLQVLQTSSSGLELKLTNVTEQGIGISGISIAGTNASEFGETDTCSPSVPALGTCSVSITFAPAQLGPRTASLTVTSSGIGSPLVIPLNGTGVVTGPNATLSAASVSVSCVRHCRVVCVCVCTSTPSGLTLSDYGTADLSISGLGPTPPFTETDNCGTSVSSGNSCNIHFRMTSTGSHTGTLTITDNGPDSPQTVSLQGSASCSAQ